MARLSGEVVTRALDDDGYPVSGARMRVYAAGTTTPVTTYSDALLTTPHAWPIVADSSGTFPAVYVPSGDYKVALATPDDAALPRSPSDNVPALSGVVESGNPGDIATIYDWDGADFEARLNAAVASGETAIHIPPGAYTISAAVTMTAPVLLWGLDAKSTIIRQTGGSASGLVWDFATYQTGGGLVGITVEAGAGFQTSGFAGTGSSGTGISVAKANTLFRLEDFAVAGFAVGLDVQGCYEVTADSFRILYAAIAGLRTRRDGSDEGAGNQFLNGDISNLNFTGDNSNSVGIDVQFGSHEVFVGVDVKKHNNPIRVRPGSASDKVRYTRFINCLGDSGQTVNWLIDANGGQLYDTAMLECWSSNSQGKGVRVLGGDVLRIDGGVYKTSIEEGIVFEGGSNASISSRTLIAKNGALGVGGHPGVRVKPGVTGLTIDGARIGNVGEPLVSGQQGPGILFEAGSSPDCRVINCDVRDNAVGALSNGNTSLMHLAGNLPRGTAGLNTSEADILYATSTGTVSGGGGPYYIGPAGDHPASGDGPWVMGRAGVVSRMFVALSVAPGSGKSWTVTLYKNGVATGITGSIADAALSLEVTSPAVSVAVNDILEIVATAVSAPSNTTIRGTLRLEP